MFVCQRSVFSALCVSDDTNAIASDCNSITFSNDGNLDCKIYINDSLHAHTGGYINLKSGKSIDLGGLDKSIIMDEFDIVFDNQTDDIKLVNIITETFQAL